jgi:tetratricopeptide (TPR) repeat protein
MKSPFGKQQTFTYVKDHTGILIVCFIFLLLGSFSLNQVLVYTPDSARYLAWSQSLAHFQGFSDNTTPEPSKYVVHAPLYSLLLAPTAWISPENVVPAKILTILFGIVLLGTVYWWSRTRLGTWRSVALCALLAVNPAMVLYSTQVLSDVPFAICAILFLALIERETKGGTERGLHLLALTATIVCGLFLREVGLALVISCTAILILKRRYKTAFLILAVSIGIFALWYIRNEVMVAGIEHPALRNSQLFFRHLFTPSNDSILSEFWARFKSNAANYGFNIIQLPFMAETILRGISTMAPSQFPIEGVLVVMPSIYHFFLVLTAVIVLIGAYDEFKNGSRFLILAAFLGFYLIPILLYPINDVRFLFPPLIIALYLFVVGFTFLVQRLLSLVNRPKGTSWLVAVSFAVLALPNIAWTLTYVSNNWRYGRSPLGFFEEMRNVLAYPTLFARPIELAGRWLAGNTDSSAVFVSRWKELGIYTRGRKVLDVDPQTLVDPFEDKLRDYDVRYIVTVVSRAGLREYEQLFAQSEHFHFQVAQRFADLEIVRVEKGPDDNDKKVSDNDSTETGIQQRFAGAIKMLERNKPNECEKILTALPVMARKQVPVLFNIAVAKEFTGNLDVANRMFEQFHEFQQAGSVVQPAWYHMEVISRLKAAMNAPSGIERATILQSVAAYYWIIGYRNQSLLTLDRSIDADSTFFPSLVFRAIYSLLNGDTLNSQTFLQRAQAIDASNALVRALTRILENFKILAHHVNADSNLAIRFDNVRQLSAMGLRENAIDELLEIHSQYPENTLCLQMLVDLYEQKERYSPALKYLKQLSLLKPNDPGLQTEMRQLVSRW